MKVKRLAVGFAGLATICLFTGKSVHADQIESVTVATSAANAGPGQGELLFSLVDGNGTGDGNNTVTLSSLSFGTGASLDSTLTSPNVAGTLGSTLSISDTLFSSSLGILFNPGATVSFLIDMTTNPDSGGTPDSFSFVMFDSSNNLVPTADPSGSNTIANFALDGSSSFVDSNFATVSNGAPTPTPEPATLLLLGSALTGLGLLRKRKNFASQCGPPLHAD